MAKGTLQIRLKSLKWEVDAGSSRWVQCNHKGLYKREAGKSGICDGGNRGLGDVL